jgi:hypothetical protein
MSKEGFATTIALLAVSPERISHEVSYETTEEKNPSRNRGW